MDVGLSSGKLWITAVKTFSTQQSERITRATAQDEKLGEAFLVFMSLKDDSWQEIFLGSLARIQNSRIKQRIPSRC